jgi:signal transduction histidine kinase
MRTHFAAIGLVLAVALGAAVLLAALILNPPRQDLEALALFLSSSGLASLLVGYVGLRLGWRARWGGLRLKIALAVAMGVVVALANVAVTAYLMFISPHDLALLSLLLIFALILSLAFGLLLSAGLTASLRALAVGARRMAKGDLTVRVEESAGDEVGEVARAFNSMADELEAAFRRQRELEQARRELIGAVSHDLRTPLASVQAMVEAMVDGVVRDPATVQRYLQTMQRETANLGALIGDLFELSQLDAGALSLQVEASPIQDLISDTLESLRVQAARKRLKLTGSVDGALPPVLMDSARVQRVLYNLVQNAIRHTPADGSIVLEAHDAGREVRVSVADSGEGIREADLPRVFDRFFRGDPARTREGAGAGIGLAIARGIVEAHGGRIWVESAPERGSRFSFVLPKASGVTPPSLPSGGLRQPEVR